MSEIIKSDCLAIHDMATAIKEMAAEHYALMKAIGGPTWDLHQIAAACNMIQICLVNYQKNTAHVTFSPPGEFNIGADLEGPVF